MRPLLGWSICFLFAAFITAQDNRQFPFLAQTWTSNSDKSIPQIAIIGRNPIAQRDVLINQGRGQGEHLQHIISLDSPKVPEKH